MRVKASFPDIPTMLSIFLASDLQLSESPCRALNMTPLHPMLATFVSSIHQADSKLLPEASPWGLPLLCV